MKRVALIIVLSLSIAGGAFAQNKKSPTSSPSKQAAKQTINIEDGETATAENPKSGVEIISNTPRPIQSKLIKIRDNFNVEMIKSVYDL
jgi:hypothetical protein